MIFRSGKGETVVIKNIYSHLQTLLPKERDAIKAWMERHAKDCARTRKDDGLSLVLTPTSIGTLVNIKCDCETTFDATDYESW